MNTQRLEYVDLLRGFAMLWMTFFHFCFDLSNAGYIQQDFYADPLWTWQRTCILSLFLFCAGLGQAIAVSQGQSWQRFGRRWLQIAGCALLVTAGSALMFPNSFIYFGVLHGMAVMLVLVRLTAGWGVWLWPLGGLVIATKYIADCALSTGATAQFLNDKPWNWLGLISVKPITEDYVPIVPWLGVMWWGMAAGTWWMTRQVQAPHKPARRKADQPGATTARPPASSTPRLLRPLAVLGGWSLGYYMLHQPVLLGGLWLWATFRAWY